MQKVFELDDEAGRLTCAWSDAAICAAVAQKNGKSVELLLGTVSRYRKPRRFTLGNGEDSQDPEFECGVIGTLNVALQQAAAEDDLTMLRLLLGKIPAGTPDKALLRLLVEAASSAWENNNVAALRLIQERRGLEHRYHELLNRDVDDDEDLLYRDMPLLEFRAWTRHAWRSDSLEATRYVLQESKIRTSSGLVGLLVEEAVERNRLALVSFYHDVCGHRFTESDRLRAEAINYTHSTVRDFVLQDSAA